MSVTGASRTPNAPPEGRRPRPREGILAIDPYVPGRSTAGGGRTLYKLSSNETPFGPSPEAMAAFRQAADRLHRYPDGGGTALRQAISARYGLDPDRIVCGAGSDQVLALLAQAYLLPGDEAIYSRHGFLIYPIATRAAGGRPVVAEEADLTASVDAILAAVTDRTRLVYLANPNNPTGTYLPFDELRRLHAGLPGNVILVIDAAYAEYVGRNDYDSGVELAATTPNVVMTRTFSKIYGLAGLRIGWCYGPAEIVDVLHRIREPFNLSTPASAAGVAALADRKHLERAVAHNEVWLPRLSREIAGLGLDVTPSVANFVLVHFSDRPGLRAGQADDFLAAAGIVVRRLEAYGLPNALRITIGTEDANRAVIAALTEFVDRAKAS